MIAGAGGAAVRRGVPHRIGAAFFIGAALLVVAGAIGAAGAPLGNEDIVRMVMAGTAEKAILERLAANPADFDLRPEILIELRRAGVGDRILEAMRRRQAAMPRVEPALPEPADTPPVPTGTLEIRFEAGEERAPLAERTAVALKSLPPRLAARGGQEVATMTDMALVVLCLTPGHIPDHWDLRSPLTAGTLPHEMLLFRAAAAVDKRHGFEILYLAREDRYELPLPEGDHRIRVGAAGKQAGSGTWRLLESDETRLAIRAGAVTRVTLRAANRLEGSFMTGFDLKTDWKVVTAQPPAEPAGGRRDGAGTEAA
ncbi:MAG: hypothetical protein ACRD6R_03590 [Candidatus Polarisedimenticolia bacterium]